MHTSGIERPTHGRKWKSAAARAAGAVWAKARSAGPFGVVRPAGGGPARVEPLELRRLMAGGPLVTEFLAVNNSSLADEDGDRGDWIEIYNPTGTDVDLTGYTLSDDPAAPGKWAFPAVTLRSGGYLTVFADAKDRAVAGSTLHTNFTLPSGGGLLTLRAADGTTELSRFDYPQQFADKPYGIRVTTDTTKLVLPNAPVKARVPTDASLGTAWTGLGYNDAGWTSGTTGVGYENEAPPPPPPGFGVRMVDVDGGTDGDMTSIAEATALLNGSAAAAAYTVVFDGATTRAAVNLGDGGSFGGDLTLPNGLGGTSADSGAAGREQYAVRVTAALTIPAGTYSVDVGSDDGMRLRIPGVSFANRWGEEFTSAANPSPADTLVFGNVRGHGHTGGSFTVGAGGLTTTLQLDFYERGGGDGLELSVANTANTGFVAGAFQLLQDGTFGWTVRDPTQPGTTPNYRSLINTDVGPLTFNKNATAYVRVPFSVLDSGDYDELRLQVKYDDGFVAYLNGVEVARRNAPATLAWNSGASGTHDDTAALVYESISVPTDELVDGANVLAFQMLNAGTGSSDFLLYPEVQGLFTRVVPDPTYLAYPTPGATNAPAVAINGEVQDTKFSVGRGFFTDSFPLAITTDTPGASIRYTTDGSAPSATRGTVYGGPFMVTGTTTVRAVAYKDTYLPSNVDTQTYLFLNDVIRQPAVPGVGFPVGPVNGQVYDYGMDQSVVNADAQIVNDMKSLPSISLVLDAADFAGQATGIYSNAGRHGRTWERPTSVEFLYPDGSKPNLHANAGLRIRGGYSRSGNNPKHGLRLFFRSEYGDGSFDHPIFGPTGAASYDSFDLRTFNNYSWSFEGSSQFTGLRDQFSRDTQLAMGWQGERGDYYHLYINGQYWGIYNSDERPEADFAADYYGGNAADYDVVKVAADSGYNLEATDGNLSAWTSLWTQAQGDMTSAANYQKLLGNNADGTRNPAYPVLLDPANLIDYMLVIYYGGNLDAPLSNFLSNTSPNNYFAIRNRVTNNQGFQFFAHDAEHTLLNVDQDRTGNAAGPWPITTTAIGKSNPQWLLQLLMANPDFKQTFADRVRKAFYDGGALTPQSAAARLQVRRNQIERAVFAESARWGDSKRPGNPRTYNDWLAEVNRILNSYVPQRSAKVIQQFVNRGWFSTATAQPTFSPPGGTVAAGAQVTIANPNAAGTIYYTLDGSDPRAAGGGLSASAAAYAGPVVIDRTRTLRARVLDGTTWSPLAEATYGLSTADLRVTELMYNPAPGGSFAADDYEFLELFNAGTAAVDLAGLTFTGITLTFPANTQLAAGQRAVVVRNTAAFRSRYGNGPTVLAQYGGGLANDGELIRLAPAGGQPVFSFTYADNWYDHTDGGGFSLVVRNPAAAQAAGTALDAAAAWRPSNDLNGKPGAADPGFDPGAVLINEVLTSTAGPAGDWVELRNTTAAAIGIGGWFLSDSPTNLRKYQIPAGTTLPANGYLVFYANTSFGQAVGSPGVLDPFHLDAGGDSVRLTSVDAAGNAGGYRERQSFAAAPAPEVTFGRYAPAGGAVGFPALAVPTPGGPNADPRLPDTLAINEIQYFPATGQEFIELRNLTSQPLALYDPANPANPWRFTDGIDFAFPAGAAVPADGYALVVAGDPAAFRSANNVPAAVPVFGPYTALDGSNVLANGGERLTVSRPAAPDPTTGAVPYVVVDSVEYGVAAPWPVPPHGSGPSLVRVNARQYADNPANWASSAGGPTPGVSNTPVVTAVVVNDGNAQRSRVTSLTVTFDRAVVPSAGAFAMVGRNGAGADVATTASNPLGDGRTWVLTFAGGTLTAAGLNDGVYDLTVVAGLVRAGSAAGPAMEANRAFKFHRLYSDADGDGDSDNSDLFQFRASYGRSAGDPAYRAYFDFDADGDVDNADLFQVRSRRGVEYKGY